MNRFPGYGDANVGFKGTDYNLPNVKRSIFFAHPGKSFLGLYMRIYQSKSDELSAVSAELCLVWDERFSVMLSRLSLI